MMFAVPEEVMDRVKAMKERNAQFVLVQPMEFKPRRTTA